MSDDATSNESVESTDTTSTDLPDWAKQKVAEANAEAAKYRVEKKDAVEAAKQAVTQEFEKKIADYDEKLLEANGRADEALHENLKLTAAVQALVPDKKIQDFAELLKGDDEAELNSHAERLKELFGNTTDEPSTQRATDRTQGNTKTPLPLNGDPLMAAVRRAVR